MQFSVLRCFHALQFLLSFSWGLWYEWRSCDCPLPLSPLPKFDLQSNGILLGFSTDFCPPEKPAPATISHTKIKLYPQKEVGPISYYQAKTTKLSLSEFRLSY